MNYTLPKLFLCAFAFIANCTFVQALGNIAEFSFLSGWRSIQGHHISALHISLEPGWKTYWRAPGDSGIPPHITLNPPYDTSNVDIIWPTPYVFGPEGNRSIGYKDRLTLPLKISLPTQTSGGEFPRFSGQVTIGLCQDVCIPETFTFDSELTNTPKRNPAIIAALLDAPLPANPDEHGTLSCQIKPQSDNTAIIHVQLTTHQDISNSFGVIETQNPNIWVSLPAQTSITQQDVTHISYTSRLAHVSGQAIDLTPSNIRFSLLTEAQVIEFNGCSKV